MKGAVRGKLLLLFIVFLYVGVNLSAQQDDWTCGITSFSGTLPSENSFIFRHFPLLVYHHISAYTTHFYTEEDLSYKKELEQTEERESLINQWETLSNERDDLLFDQSKDDYSRLTSEINELRRKMENPVIDATERREDVPLRIIVPGGGSLLYNSWEEAEKEEPDLILSGFIGRSGDFLLLEITGQFKTGGEILSLWTGAGRMDDLDRLAQEASDTLKPYLLGREWAALTIEVEPGEAQIFLEGRSVGIGRTTAETLAPGLTELEVRLPGYGLYKEIISLGSSQRVVKQIVLTPGEEDLIKIISQPPGAQVIVGSSYKGETPLYINRPSLKEHLALSLKGYDRVDSFLGPDSPDLLEISFFSGGVNWEEERLVSKDKFYNSLGVFTLSLAAPIILYGVAENQALMTNGYALSYKNTPSQDLLDKYNQAYTNFNISYGSFWGTLAVSGVLLGVSINRLVKYIKASENSIEQKDRK